MSLTPCPTTIPKYYTVTLHLIAALSVPVNMVGFYLVWCQSPKMKGYKYCLCYLQLVSFISELHMSLISPGYYFFPMIGGYNTGAELMSSHLSMTIWVFILAFELPSALLCFVFRHNAAEEISRTVPSKMYMEKFCLLLCHLFPFATAFSMWKSRLTYQQKYDFMSENWPQCMYWMRFEAFEVYDYKLNPWLAVVGIGALSFVLLVYTYGLTLGFHTILILQKHQKSMSRQTYQMHKMFLFSLLMQLLIPGILIVVPFGIFMILSNPRYRRVLKEKLIKILRLKQASDPRNGNSVRPSQRSISFVVIQSTTTAS
ncbi:hypothetical protein GCK72_001630 [Caenorhabditis remanei]|uniref:Uncharacterized protein n=1 Tax=Caenorhabditis remanei TaxID=31234 RepID=A0A6A5HUA8_CAERE|nr:hypothetical protein GCK72_001630 [Caenorhabditis remanei]KAF1769813.1 hypothetical protein GCK72_001630 [Caenorhabditis remanei]